MSGQGEIPLGECQCGCGGRTNLSTTTNRRLGIVAGQPRRFIAGHAARAANADIPARFFTRVNKTSTCWEWTGRLNASGYGQFIVHGKRLLTHRWSYEHHVGPIPEGLHIDHLCRNRKCCNPEHLEPVTPAENVARGDAATRTRCKQGHEFTPENTRIAYSHGRPYQKCRACHRIWLAAARERRRAKAADAA